MKAKKEVRDSKKVIEYLTTIGYYENRTEANVKKIFVNNINRYKNGEILFSFLCALAIELLYFKNNIGAFKDLKLRDALLAGDELMYVDVFDISNQDIKPLVDKLLME